MKRKATSKHSSASRGFDWDKVDSLTDADIGRAVADDPDAPPELGREFFDTARIVVPPAEIDVKRVRARTGLSQSAFAERYGFSLKTLQKWEQRERRPSRSARVLLWLIEQKPEAVEAALQEIA